MPNDGKAQGQATLIFATDKTLQAYTAAGLNKLKHVKQYIMPLVRLMVYKSIMFLLWRCLANLLETYLEVSHARLSWVACKTIFTNLGDLPYKIKRLFYGAPNRTEHRRLHESTKNITKHDQKILQRSPHTETSLRTLPMAG